MSVFQVRDLVTTYHRGYWRVTDVIPDLLIYVLVMTVQGNNPQKSRQESCDLLWCQKVDAAWIKQKKEEVSRDYLQSLKLLTTPSEMG